MNDGLGHGHVKPRPDGDKARCGGPRLCADCARELAEFDGRPFPVQGGHTAIGGRHVNLQSTTIPWWLAEIAYEHYAKRFGTSQSLQRLAERGGFSREELLMLLRKEERL